MRITPASVLQPANMAVQDQPAAVGAVLTREFFDCLSSMEGGIVCTDRSDQTRAGPMKEGFDLPLHVPLHGVLRKITERLAGELASPSPLAPNWSPVEWRLARAVAAIHCVSPLLAGSLRWDGPAQWREFLADQKAHVAARHRRIHDLLDQIDARSREEGIAIVGLKGAALHSMGFYSAGERPMADVDLLVNPSDAARTERLLQSLGFSESFTMWKHGVFVPKICKVHASMGEHRDNYLKIELHTRIAEKLPLRITDVTDFVYPRAPHPGLNAYPSMAALMIHLLIHGAGAMAYRALRLVHLHDIALVCSRMADSDWGELADRGKKAGRRWWASPPLQLAARYYPEAVPRDVLAAIFTHCPWPLRHVVRHYQLSDVSLSYPWIEAFPGIAWSRSFTEVIQYIGGRVWPDKESLRMRDVRVETDFVASQSQWPQLSQGQRMLRWMTSKPFRAETLHAVRAALAQSH
jgi:hypothetical protein